MDTLLVTNIQRMCFHDGPGIRTTVFLKGCGIHCPWCSNPENISFATEAYSINGRDGVYGREYTAEELADILLKDITFYGDNGGVTFSGGEPLLHIRKLVPVIWELKKSGVNVAAETSLFVPEENIRLAAENIDYFIIDVKILDKVQCLDVLGGEIDQYLYNVEYLYSRNTINVFRIPLCYEYTFTDGNKRLIKDFISRHKTVPVQLFAVHGLGEKKYQSLGRKMPDFNDVDKDELDDLADELNSLGAAAEIIRI